MNTRTERHDTPTGFAEVGTITHEGRDFSAGGACVTDEAIVVYPGKPTRSYITGWPFVHDNGDVFNWGSVKLGSYTVTGHTHGFHGVKLTCYRVRLDDGREYVGRGLGAGMALRARRVKVHARMIRCTQRTFPGCGCKGYHQAQLTTTNR